MTNREPVVPSKAKRAHTTAEHPPSFVLRQEVSQVPDGVKAEVKRRRTPDLFELTVKREERRLRRGQRRQMKALADEIGRLKSHLPLQACAFLAAYALVGNVTKAAELAKCARSMHYVWLEDPDYEKLFEAARLEARDHLEEDARRRACEGTLKPVFYQGKQCGVIREYSDMLLIALLNAAWPEKYKYRADIRHSGELNITGALAGLSDEELERIAEGEADPE